MNGDRELIQDWKDYNESLIFTVSDEYYKQQGIDAYSHKTKKIVPNAITNCYPHALSVAKIVKGNLVNYDLQNKKIKILECGAGSGIFARHFLLAARDIDILDSIEYLIADYSKSALEQVQNSRIFTGFVENKHFKFLELDLLNINGCKDLNSQPYKLEGISVVVMNYFLDALPLTVLRKNKTNSDTLFEELQIKFTKAKEKNNDEGEYFLQSLKNEERWVNYDFNQQSPAEQKYKMALIKSSENVREEIILYSYSPLEVCENIFSVCDDNAFIFAADMPTPLQMTQYYHIYADTVAHFVNADLIKIYLLDMGIKNIYGFDPNLCRLILFKNPDSEKMFKKIYEEEFVLKNNTNVYVDLRKALNAVKSPHSHTLVKYLVEKFLEIDGYSYINFLFLGKYYKFIGNLPLALESLKRCKAVDFLNSVDIADTIKELEEQVKKAAV